MLMGLYKRIISVVIILLLSGSCAVRETADPSVSPAETITPETPEYALLVKQKDNPYMLKMYEGFLDACAELGAKPVFYGPDSYTAQAQIDMIEKIVEAGHTDAIAVAANDMNALEPALSHAMEKGIKVLSLDSAVNPESRMLHVQQANPEIIGRVLIQAAFKMTDGRGTAGLISSTETATNQNLWISWMHRELTENPEKYKDFILLPTRYGDDLPHTSQKVTQELLAEHPELTIIITPSVVGMLAVGQELQVSGSAVKFTGLGLPSEIAPYIEDGRCPWMYIWNPIDIGYLAAYSADALHSGQITGSVGGTFTAGRIGQRVILSGVDGGTEVLLGDPMKFDSDNIGEWKLVY